MRPVISGHEIQIPYCGRTQGCFDARLSGIRDRSGRQAADAIGVVRRIVLEVRSPDIAVAPADSSQVYVSSYAGFYKSSDWGANWDTTHEGIYAARINAMAVDPSKILVQNNGYLMSFGRGRNNIWEDVVTPESCGEVCDILINPENPNTVLILEGYG